MNRNSQWNKKKIYETEVKWRKCKRIIERMMLVPEAKHSILFICCCFFELQKNLFFSPIHSLLFRVHKNLTFSSKYKNGVNMINFIYFFFENRIHRYIARQCKLNKRRIEDTQQKKKKRNEFKVKSIELTHS